MSRCIYSVWKLKGKIPLEDLGLLMLDHFQIKISHKLIQKMMENSVVAVIVITYHME
nr:hypothetical protein [Elizabethkingia sp. YR214]